MAVASHTGCDDISLRALVTQIIPHPIELFFRSATRGPDVRPSRSENDGRATRGMTLPFSGLAVLVETVPDWSGPVNSDFTQQMS